MTQNDGDVVGLRGDEMGLGIFLFSIGIYGIKLYLTF
jgi:hypothetical protein